MSLGPAAFLGLGGLGVVGELFRRARAALEESADHLEAIRLIESQAGAEIRG